MVCVFSLNFSSFAIVIHVKLLHPYPSWSAQTNKAGLSNQCFLNPCLYSKLALIHQPRSQGLSEREALKTRLLIHKTLKQSQNIVAIFLAL